jgi:hypothetical protein
LFLYLDGDQLVLHADAGVPVPTHVHFQVASLGLGFGLGADVVAALVHDLVRRATTFQAQIRDFRVGFIPRLLDGILQVLLPTLFFFLRIRGNCQSSITTLNLEIFIFETKWVGTVTVNNQTVI